MVFGDILQRYSTQYKYTVQGILYRLLDQSTHSEYTVHIHNTWLSFGFLVTYYREISTVYTVHIHSTGPFLGFFGTILQRYQQYTYTVYGIL